MPNYYNKNGMECFQVIETMCKEKNGYIGFILGNIIKYLWRYKEKGGKDDLIKAENYLNKLIEEEYPQENVDENTDEYYTEDEKLIEMAKIICRHYMFQCHSCPLHYADCNFDNRDFKKSLKYNRQLFESIVLRWNNVSIAKE